MSNVMSEESYKDMDSPYTNRELREKWHDLSNAISTLSADMFTGFTEVKTKQDTTNGRVKDLELSRARSEGFYKATAIFGAAAWTTCFAFTSWVAIQVMDSSAQISALNAKLSAYDIQISK